MSIYSLAPIFDPQYVAAAAAALLFATANNPSAVPGGYAYQINVARVANRTAAPVSLEIWRVPAGAAADNAHIVIPQINVPVATQTAPHMDLLALWGIVLQPGDAIWAVAGAAASLIFQGDGVVIQL